MNALSWFRINVRDGLVLRDGRPNAGRSESQTLDFPNPGTIAGAVRTALGRPEGKAFDPGAVNAVLKARVRGPLLITGDTDEPRVYVRRPADALFITDDHGIEHVRALRLLAEEGTTDLSAAAGASKTALSLIGLPAGLVLQGKASARLPAFWSWPGIQRWLERSVGERNERPELYAEDSIFGLQREQRLNVAIDPDTYTATDGMLFETTALKFQREQTNGFPEDLGLFVEVDTADVDKPWNQLSPGLRPLGGERRLVAWDAVTSNPLPTIPSAVTAWASAKEETTVIRVILLTAAWFTGGSLPSYVLEPRYNVTPRLIGALVGRPETISGWDFANGAPKPSRRLVSAGSVYWLELNGTPDDRRRWVESTWMTNISDGEQERSDGFGLAVIGVE